MPEAQKSAEIGGAPGPRAGGVLAQAARAPGHPEDGVGHADCRGDGEDRRGPEPSAISAVRLVGASVRDRGVDELAEELAVVGARAAGLGHEDADQLLLRIDPEVRPRRAAPGDLARPPRHRREAVLAPDREAQAEGVALHAEKLLARTRPAVQQAPQ